MLVKKGRDFESLFVLVSPLKPSSLCVEGNKKTQFQKPATSDKRWGLIVFWREGKSNNKQTSKSVPIVFEGCEKSPYGNCGSGMHIIISLFGCQSCQVNGDVTFVPASDIVLSNHAAVGPIRSCVSSFHRCNGNLSGTGRPTAVYFSSTIHVYMAYKRATQVSVECQFGVLW